MLHEKRSQTALIVLDMINDHAHPQGKNFHNATTDIVPFIEGELRYFRERMRPVIFCNTFRGGDDQAFGDQVIQPLSPRTKEFLVTKTRPNAFYLTELAQILHDLQVGKLTLVGAFSHTSVAMTAASALDRGFSVGVPETCICSSDPADHSAALRLIDGWILEMGK